MNRRIIVNKVPGEKRIAVIEDSKLVEFSITRNSSSNCLGNIYRGTVKRVIPGMQSAFIDFGGERTGFIYIRDVKSNISYEEFQKNVEDDDQSNAPPSEDITTYIKDGQKILVQVIKEPIGQKGARLTTHISIPGRFAVLMPTIEHVGISKKIRDPEKRDALRKLGKKVTSKGYGIILRTMAENASVDIIEKDIVWLIKKWKDIEASFKKGKGDYLLSGEHSSLIETIKNTHTELLEEIIVDDKEDFNMVKEYLSTFIPEKKHILKLHTLPYPVFDYYSIESEIDTTLKKKIWLKSGGFLYIEQTEALTVIDVNTGKFLGKASLEKTVLKTNIEAADEIAYHIRLRNLAGIIIIDFIDMRNSQSRKKVIKYLENQLEKDPAKTSVYYFTKLGLIQITRKRTSESNITTLTENCTYCSGNGIIKSAETVSFDIIREIQRQNRLYNVKQMRVEAHPDIIFILQHQLKKEISETEKSLKVSVELTGNTHFHREHFIVKDILKH